MYTINYKIDNYNNIIPTAAVNEAFKDYLYLPIYAKQGGYLHQAGEHWTERDHAYGMYYMQLTIEGEGILNYKGKTYKLKVGDLFFIQAENYHFYRTGSAGHWKYCYLNLYGDLCNSFYNLFHKDLFTILSVKDLDKSLLVFDQVYDKIKANSFEESLDASKLLSNFLHELVSNNKMEDKTKLETLGIEHIINYINCNYTSDITIAQLSERFHFSKEHLIRKFRHYLGCTPYQFIINLRVRYSKELLLNSDNTVEEIADLCGFKNTQNMIYHFKMKTNTTPLKYKSNMLKTIDF